MLSSASASVQNAAEERKSSKELKARKRLHHLRHEYIVPSREKQRVDEKTDHPTLTSSQAIYSSTSGFSSRRAQQAHFMYGLHVPKQQDNQRMDLPKARGAVSIKTFHANQVLPRSKRSFCLRDFTLLREIFVLAENYAQMDGTEVRLTDVLRAYDIVLQRHGKDPTEDTFYYRMLLKLSLRSENDWWNRLNQEIANSNALFKGNSFRDRKILLCYWLQWRCYQKKGLNQAKFQSSLRYFYHTGDSSLQDEEAKKRFHLSQAEGLGCNQTLEFSTLQALNSENGQGVVQPILQLSVKTTRSFSGKDASLANASLKLPVHENKESQTCIENTMMAQPILNGKSWAIKKFMRARRQNISSMRDLSEVGEAQYTKCLIHSVFGAWNNFIDRRNIFGDQERKRHLLILWHRKAAKIYRAHLSASKMIRFKKIRITKFSLSIWRRRLLQVIQQDAVFSQCQNKHKVLILTCCLHEWYTYGKTNTRKRAQQVSCIQRRKCSLKLSILREWQSWAQRKCSLRQVSILGASWRRRFLQKAVLKAWSIWWQKVHKRERRMEIVTVTQRKRKLLEIACAWRDEAYLRRSTHATMLEAVHEFKTRYLQKLLTAWKAWYLEEKHLSSIRHMLMCYHRRGFARWRNLSILATVEKQKLRSMENSCRVAMKRHYWKLWCQWLVIQTVLRGFLTKKKQELVSACLKGLHWHSLLSRKSIKKMEEAISFWWCRMCDRAIKRWKAQVDHGQYHDKVLCKETETMLSCISNKINKVTATTLNSNRWHNAFLRIEDLRTIIRKWKYFLDSCSSIESCQSGVMNLWSTCTLKTAIVGWKIQYQKKRCKQKVLEESQQATRFNLSLLKKKFEREEDGKLNRKIPMECARFWKNLVFLRRAFTSWVCYLTFKRNDLMNKLEELWMLKCWWLLSWTAFCKYLARNSVYKELVNQQNLMSKSIDAPNSCSTHRRSKDLLSKIDDTATNGKKCESNLQLLGKSSNFKEKSETQCMKIAICSWLIYAQQQQMAKRMKEVSRRRLVSIIIKCWRYLTATSREEQVQMLAVKSRLNVSYEVHEVFKRLLLSWTSKTVFLRFNRWRLWCKCHINKRRQNRSALEHLASALLKKSLRSFQIFLGLIKKSRAGKMQARCSIQGKIFLAMKNKYNQQVVLATSNRRAVSHYIIRTCRIAWMIWQHYVAYCKKSSSAKAKALGFFAQSKLKKGFKAWFEVFLSERAKLEYWTCIKIQIDCFSLHKTFGAWRAISCKHLVQLKHVLVFQQQQRAAYLCRNLHFWIYYTHKRKCLKAAQEMFRHRSLKSCFMAWTSYVIHLKRKRVTQNLVDQILFKRFGRTAFLGWQDITTIAKHVHFKHVEAASRLRYTLMLNAFTNWSHVVANCIFYKKILDNHLLQYKKKQFNILFQVTKQQQRSRQSCLLTMRLKRDSCLWRNFQLWKERTCKQALYQQEILKALKYERCRVLKHTFSSLLEFKKQCQNKQEFHLSAKQKMQNVHLKLMLKEWLKQSHILCDKRVRVVLLRQSHEQRMLAMAFDKLRSFTEYNWHLRSQVMQGFHKHLYAKKMDKASSWHKNQLVGMSLNQWYKVVKRTQILKAGIMKLQFRPLSRMYHKWRSFFSYQKTLSTRAKVLSSHYQSKVLNRHWAHWQARAESAQYEHQFLLFKSFKKWSKYAKGNALWRSKEQFATQTILQSLQKRIIWAWHSLVRELAIRREEHQQQRFLHREAMGMATRTERRLKMELLYLATKAWRNRVHLTNSMAALINKHNLALKQDVWTGWVLLVDRSSKETELKWRWLFAMLKNHFSMWQKATKEQLQEVANQGIQAAKFSNWKHVKKTWVQWRSQSESGKERAKVLQECTHLIQSGLFWDTVREILHVWSDYALERNRQRERSWAAEASYKRRKLADYFSAWHHYTLASTESAFTLQGSIQIYHQAKSSKSSMQEPPYRSIDGDKTEYRFQNTFVGIPNYTPHFGKSSALATASQKVIIEEVSQSSDQSGTILFPLSSAPDQDSEQRRIGLALDPLRQGHMIESNAMNDCFFESLDNQDARTWNGASHSAHQLCLESNRMDEVVANDGCWPYELPKTGVAWIRYSVKQHNPLQQSWQK